jgi:hypothetical protein
MALCERCKQARVCCGERYCNGCLVVIAREPQFQATQLPINGKGVILKKVSIDKEAI